jgi:hypothetical protein
VSYALLPKVNGAGSIEADRNGDKSHDRQRQRKQGQSDQEVDQRFEIELAARGNEAPKAVFRKMFDFDPAGQRFR